MRRHSKRLYEPIEISILSENRQVHIGGVCAAGGLGPLDHAQCGQEDAFPHHSDLGSGAAEVGCGEENEIKPVGAREECGNGKAC